MEVGFITQGIAKLLSFIDKGESLSVVLLFCVGKIMEKMARFVWWTEKNNKLAKDQVLGEVGHAQRITKIIVGYQN